MAETRSEMAARLFRFRDPVVHSCASLAEFHEWVVQLALDGFASKTKAKPEPVCLYVFYRPGGISVLDTHWQNEREKSAVMDSVRAMCQHPMAGVEMVGTANEVWIAANYNPDGNARADVDELMKKYGAVRNFPDREDGLLVQSFERGGGAMATKWVAKVKEDPAESYLLARDDIDMEGVEHHGQHWGYFAPASKVPT